MSSINVFDPAMCCSSGVCGPKPDQAVCIFCRSEPVY
ncbi:arsenic metallochaperone ArsD family protein [Salinisphaera sp. G21_0]|nr:arsenic metallochaperone ArsD family protein [Salinisphaera sp. G21_0]